MSTARLLNVTRTFKDNTTQVAYVNPAHIQSVEWVERFQSTALQMASGHTIWIKERPEYVSEYING